MAMKAFVAVLIAMVAASGAVAAAGGRAPSEVEITDYYADGAEAVFKGRVTSPASRCEGRGRKVKVVGYNDGGPRRTFGTDKTNAAGKFSVREPIPFSEQFARAKVAANDACKGDRSEPVLTAG
ncbi:MAG: hypothetical protein M3Y34_00420 [Actinomycetota bacterium]|nr:hypothetical protein [Actinomycetota bacterium]